MMKQRAWIVLTLSFVVVLVIGCSSSDELSASDQSEKETNTAFERIDDEESIIPETDEPVEIEVVEDEPIPEREQNVPVRSSAGTQEKTPVETVKPTPVQPTVTSQSGAMMWSVQLGAFKNESGAFELVEDLKKKFNQPVYKRYDAVTGYYKVTLGSYQTREQATAFKLDVQSRGFPDAFTVEVAR
jgi:cell division protein FtsN